MPSAAAFLEDEPAATSAKSFLSDGKKLSASKFLSDVEPVANPRPLAGKMADAASRIIGDPSGMGLAGFVAPFTNPSKTVLRTALGPNADLSKPLLSVDLPDKNQTTPIGEGVGKFVKGLIEGGSSPEAIGQMAVFPKMLADMAGQAPEQAAKFGEAIGKKDAAGATEALLNYIGSVGPLAGMAHGALKTPIDPSPPTTGKSFTPPEGARPPVPKEVVQTVKQAATVLPQSAEAAAKKILTPEAPPKVNIEGSETPGELPKAKDENKPTPVVPPAPAEQVEPAPPADVANNPPTPAAQVPVEKEPWQMTREEYNKTEPKSDGKRDVMLADLGHSKVPIWKNPTPQDYQALTIRHNKEFPNDASGDPKTRFTIDSKGNRYIWPAGEAAHSTIEAWLKERAITANQNTQWLSHRYHVAKALLEGKPVPPEVLKDYPELAEQVGEKQVQAAEAAERTGSGPLTPQEKGELNELRIIKENRGKLGRLNQARLEHLESREAKPPVPPETPKVEAQALSNDFLKLAKKAGYATKAEASRFADALRKSTATQANYPEAWQALNKPTGKVGKGVGRFKSIEKLRQEAGLPPDAIDLFQQEVGGQINLPSALKVREDFKAKGRSLRNLFTDKGGIPLDKAAQALEGHGIEGDEDLIAKIEAAAEARDALWQKHVKNAPEPKSIDKQQYDDWAQSIKKGGHEVAADTLNVGDVLDVDGEHGKVIDVDEDGTVTIEDGRRFGTQRLESGDSIHVEQVMKAETSTEFLPEEKPAATPKLGAMEKGTGDLLKGQSEDFALTGGKGTDYERIQKAKEQAAKDKAESEKGQGEIIGMGGAVPSEFEHSPQTPTGIKNATVDVERAKRGLPAAVQPARKSFGEVWDRAMAKVDQDPAYQDRLVDELREHPRALTDEEDAVLLQRQIDLQNEYGKATRSLAQNHADGFEVGIEQDKLRVAELSDQLLDLYNINKRVGTETGRGLAARRMMANEDFSLAQMELGKRAAKGGERLTDAERQQIQKLHDEIQSWQKKFDEHVAASKEAQAKLEFQLATEKLKKEAKPLEPGIQRIVDRIGATLHSQADAARARIRARAQTLSAGLDPTVLADVAIIGADHIFNGAVEFADWSKKMLEDLGDQLKPHLDEIFTAANKKFDEITDKTALDKARLAQEKFRKMTAPQRVEYTTKKIADKLKAGKRDEITSQVQRLARSFVEQYPNLTRDGLLDLVHDVLKKIDPTIERADARDMISGYGDFKQLSKDQISIRLRDLKGQMQQVAKLEDMQRGQPPVKTGLERRIPSPEESRLIKAVNEAKRQFQIPITDPNTQLKSSLDTLKARLTSRIREYQDKLANQDFAPKERPEIKLDNEALRLKAEAERAKEKYLSGLRADRLKNRTRIEKALDATVKWSRGFLLSGPSTLAKLTAAAFWRMVQNPIEEGVGSALKQLPYVKGIAARAPIEGRGFNVKHEAKALTEGFMQGLKDAEQTIRTGKSTLDRVFGNRQDSGIGELDDEQKSVVDFFGHLHGALKAPVKRAAFARAFEQQAEFYTSKGIDVSDPAVQTRMAVEAYKRANKDIFMQPNRYADRVRRFVTSLEEKDKITGKTPATAKASASAIRTIVPIVKVPTNIVGEAIEYATGLMTGSAKTAKAFRAGIDQLKPEQADQIMRELKKGSVGTALLLLGYFLPQFVGGFYQQGQKRKSGDVGYGGIRVFGHDVPKTLLHTPAIEVLQLGATVSRVADSKLRKKDLEKQGIGEGIWAGALGLADDVPFIQNTLELSKLFNPQEKGQYLGELAKSRLIPQLISQSAEFQDKDEKGNPIKRDAKTIPQHLETGIPYLRQTVPEKKPKKTGYFK